jgi:glycosyltransferase involved in cell wall biosynthesis
MNILFLTLIDFNNIQEPGIYQDLLREFSVHNHKIYVLSPVERRKQQDTHLIKDGNTTILKLKIGNTQKTNVIEKGVSTVLIEPIFVHGIKKYFSDVKFDLVMYSTPPITFCKAVEYVKKRDEAKTYLLLKDIFPQNAVDMGMMSKSGLKGLLYRYFRAKEKKLYALSDRIGCMSPANVDFVLKNNPEISAEKVAVCPNCIEPCDMSISNEERIAIRKKYGIPQDRKIFVYGGNLGKPQGIEFLIRCLISQKNNKEAYFLIVGDGTEYPKLETFTTEHPQDNVKLMKRLPKEDYDTMVGACDVGMIFLDHRFTIPNFPSRLLSYMQAKIPVLACTDPNTDIGKVIIDGGFGWWCESDDVDAFNKCVRLATTNDNGMGVCGYEYLKENYSVEKALRIIMAHF